MNPLIVTPSPESTESLLGYALKVSENNGYSSPWHILKYADISQAEMNQAGFPIDNLAGIVGKNPSAFESISYSGVGEDGEWEFKLLGHSLGKGLSYSPLRLRSPAFCPHCIKQDGFIDAFWDLSLAVACPRHLCKPVKHCHVCDEPVRWFRQGLMKCRCGAELFETEPLDNQPEVIELMALLLGKLHNKPIAALENTSNFPLTELNQMPLRSLLALLPSLAKLSTGRKPSEENDSEFDIIKKASNVLNEWPFSFYQFIRDYGNRTKDLSTKTVGYRKRFENLFSALFKNSLFAKDVSFMREEFIRFGLEEWGENIVDNKMLRDTSINRRYISLTEWAKKIGVRRITLKRWANKEKIVAKCIPIRNGVRYVGDCSSLPIPNETNLPVHQAREAAVHLGMPVSVLAELKKSGQYVAYHLPKFKYGYSEKDLDNFRKQLFEASSPLPHGLPTDVKLVSLDYIMQHMRFWSASSKAAIVVAYLEGDLKSVGKTGDDFKQIYFAHSAVNEFASEKRNVNQGKNGAMTYVAAAELLGGYPTGIAGLVEEGYICKLPDTAFVCLERESVLKFHDKYVLLTHIASERKTSSKRLLEICECGNIPVLFIQRAKYRSTPFILRSDGKRLLNEMENNPSRSDKAAIKLQFPQDAVSKLKRYLDQLKENNKLLPRNGHLPNKQKIAEECGMNRNTIVLNKTIKQLLDAYDFEERKLELVQDSPSQLLRTYIHQLELTGAEPPRRKDGRMNRHAIAKICKFSRHHLYNNYEVEELMDKLEART